MIKTPQSACDVPVIMFLMKSLSGGVNDGHVILGSFKLPQSDVDGDSTLTLGLQFVHDPSILEGTFTGLLSFLLELLDGSLVNTSALVDQVPSCGGLARVDVTNHDNVDMSLFLAHYGMIKSTSCRSESSNKSL